MSRPEWAEVAIAAELSDLATAFTLAAVQHPDQREQRNLRVAASQTRLARVLHEQATYSTDTAIAWCEAGRAYLRAALRSGQADTSTETRTTEGNLR